MYSSAPDNSKIEAPRTLLTCRLTRVHLKRAGDYSKKRGWTSLWPRPNQNVRQLRNSNGSFFPPSKRNCAMAQFFAGLLRADMRTKQEQEQGSCPWVILLPPTVI